MKAVEFKEQNVVFAEHQEEFNSLPAHRSDEGVVTSCFELDEDELEQVRETGKVFIQIHTFNQALQPLGGSLLNPFK